MKNYFSYSFVNTAIHARFISSPSYQNPCDNNSFFDILSVFY